jgi:hypothetical protein
VRADNSRLEAAAGEATSVDTAESWQESIRAKRQDAHWISPRAAIRWTGDAERATGRSVLDIPETLDMIACCTEGLS